MRSCLGAAVALAVMSACTGAPDDPSEMALVASEPSPLPTVVLPARYVPVGPPYSRGHTAAVSTDADLCELGLVSCVPPGLYQQGAADGDWCSWTYYPAEYFRLADLDDGSVAYLDLAVTGWKDADGQLVALFEGDQLGYGPTTGAQRFSEGLPATQGWEGDGKRRGCAEWSRVGTLDDAVSVSTPTVLECAQLIQTGEAAQDRVGEIAAAGEAELADLALVVIEALAAGPTSEPRPAMLERIWSTLTGMGAAMKDAYPALKRAADCHRVMGDDNAANAMSSIARGYLHVWAGLKKSCPTDYAPLGFDCTRL